MLYSDDDVDMTSFQIPKDFDVNKVVEAITTVSFQNFIIFLTIEISRAMVGSSLRECTLRKIL